MNVALPRYTAHEFLQLLLVEGGETLRKKRERRVGSERPAAMMIARRGRSARGREWRDRVMVCEELRGDSMAWVVRG